MPASAYSHARKQNNELTMVEEKLTGVKGALPSRHLQQRLAQLNNNYQPMPATLSATSPPLRQRVKLTAPSY
jgi:hypothetical protein